MTFAQKLKAKMNPVVNKQSGFTLIELLIVLVVIAILSLVGYLVKPKVMDMVSTYQVTNAVSTISAETLAWKGAKTNFADISVASMCDSGQLSLELCGAANDGVGTNPFGGDYTLTVNAEDANLIDLTMTKVPGAIGKKLANTLKDHSVGDSAKFNGTPATSADKKGTAGSITMTI